MVTRQLNRLALILVFSGIACLTAMSKSTEWLLTPQYDKMEFFTPDLYRVSVNGKFGLINTQGEIVLAPDYDIIYDIYEGIAVFGNYTSDGAMIKGSVTEEGKVSLANGSYYFHADYPFFSEGFIPAIDASGRYGYLDEQCRPAFKFGEDETRPFSEGVAAVGEGEDFHWMTLTGENLSLILPNGSYPFGGTNFHNGIAYLWDEDGVFFILDDTGDVRKIRPRELVADYLYRVDTGKGLEVEYTEYEKRYDRTYKPTQRDEKWAYFDSKGNPLTAFQYEQIDYFQGVSARAKSGGKWGLVQVVEDKASFYTKSDKKLKIFSSKRDCECSFDLSVPDKWKGEPLTISVKDPDTGQSFDLQKKGESKYVFAYSPDKTKTTISKSFDIEVKKDDITLWQGQETYNFAQAIKLTASLSVKNKADSNNSCLVTATISNPSSIPVSTTVTLSGGGSNSQFNPRRVNLTIPAHSKRSITSAFALRGVELDGWCSVSTSDGAQARRNNLELKPRD